jgi:hypothetical protein
MMRLAMWLALAAALVSCAQGGDATTDKRRASLEQLLRVLPKSKPWEDWLAKSGELPPDFDALPSVHALPDPLAGVPPTGAQSGRLRHWEQRRGEILALFHHWIIGSIPPKPDNLQAKVTAEKEEAGALVRDVELSFGPERKAHVGLELLIPKGQGPFPVFMTQRNHRGWALIALRRGYLCCVYRGNDNEDDTDSFIEAYPQADWSKLTRRAWAASRCLDYLETVPVADTKRTAITGHSRNGKLSLIAGAIDERFGVVISSSSGAGGSLSARQCSEIQQQEGIEFITRVFPDWFHPRFRFFAGREHKLPVDLHELAALAAPRACLLSIALNDPVEDSWAMQQTYLSAKPVYALYGAEKKLRIEWRPGSHETWTATIERFVDWCDTAFGRGEYSFPERLIHDWDWEAWKKRAPEQPAPGDFPARTLDDALTLNDGSKIADAAGWEKKRAEVRSAVNAMLGDAPRAANPGHTYGLEASHIAALFGRAAPKDLAKEQLMIGEYISADLFLPADLKKSDRKAPVVVWLHPACHARGYVSAYKRGDEIFVRLAKEGFVVCCFDQIGHGRRLEEAENFGARYPQWSLLGKMVRDTRAALDALPNLPYVDAKRIYALGYAQGALVGLHAGALDERFAGFAFVAPPQPFRLDTPERGAGGLQRYAQEAMLLPRLGLFVGQEARVPYDTHLLLACLAPRPALVVSQTLDREARVEDVTKAVDAARAVYKLHGAEGKLELATPEEFNRFGPEAHALVVEWLKKQAQLGETR